jgi:hypothetical protein
MPSQGDGEKWDIQPGVIEVLNAVLAENVFLSIHMA